ncbi:T9SS type A sorting domain-containing protein [Mesonia ostreae]|uniref:T9SS type A sorting domain-containing protein n=1 Tax=Mesonia ostreae TaxID=861110 RepID=A0ABU2KKI2_9FLAO|nr:T9SS type A sorting domain-containing protein [Mesonia ostreae]MDT0295247.1 T9SS type A sorting domain-containing protein [Mesonia ostreae]
MKKLTYLIILMFSFKGFAQVAPLQDHTWYLEKLVINGNDFPPPAAYQNSYTVLFEDNSPHCLFGAPCYSLYTDLTYNQNQSFTINNTNTPLDCGEIPPYVIDFEEMFMDNFTNSGLPGFNPYVYTFSNQSTYIQLTITNANGVQAIYRNEQLAVGNKKEVEVTLFPNPVGSKFQLEMEQEKKIRSVRIFSVNGKEILKFNEAQSSYDVSQLKQGIYFIQIETEERKSIIKLMKG